MCKGLGLCLGLTLAQSKSGGWVSSGSIVFFVAGSGFGCIIWPGGFCVVP